MSGGSYDYLFTRARPGGVGAYREELEQMERRLQSSGYYAPARATREVLRLLEGAELMAAALTEVWQCVEWVDSGDSAEDCIVRAVAKFRPWPPAD